MLGFISQKWFVKLGSRYFSDSHMVILCPDRNCILLCLYVLVVYTFCHQKRKVLDSLCHGAAISFSPSVRFTLMHVYMNTGIK